LPFEALLVDWAWFAPLLFWFCEFLAELCAWPVEEPLPRLEAFLLVSRAEWLGSLLFAPRPLLSEPEVW
jgi:hypothetical protein